MNYFLKGITYSYNRNIGWQDRMIRTIVGVLAIIGAIYFFKTNLLYTLLLGVFAIAQFGTVLSAKCILCYFAGQCTIGASERKKLDHQGIKYDFSK
ncbi:MAG: DUF2892 domain-containing protein [Bacteroidota bacterium]